MDEDVRPIDMFLTSVRIRLWKVYDFVRTFFLYYMWSWKFFFSDIFLLLPSLWRSPYRTLRKENEKRGEERSLGPYGETPFSTLDAILHRFHIPRSWTWIELGFGRGRSLIWLSFIYDQKRLLGVEAIGDWCQRMQKVISIFGIERIQLFEEDMCVYLAQPIQNPDETVIYLYLSSMSDAMAQQLASMISHSKGVHIISVSFPISHFEENIVVLDTFSASFPWGTTDVYYQKVL